MSLEDTDTIRAWMDAIHARDLDTMVSLADDGTPFQHAQPVEDLDLETLAAAMAALHDGATSPDPEPAEPGEAGGSTDPPWLRHLVRGPADQAQA